VEAVQADIFTQLRRLIPLEDAVSRHKGENRKEKGWEEFLKISIPEQNPIISFLLVFVF